MSTSIAHFLEIKGYVLYSERMNDANELIIRVGRPQNGDICPYCDSKKYHLHAKGKWQIKKHSNFQKKQIYIKVKRKRLKCLSCQKTFTQKLVKKPSIQISPNSALPVAKLKKAPPLTISQKEGAHR